MDQTTTTSHKSIKIGIAGMGAVGQAVAKALIKGIKDFNFCGYSDLEDKDIAVPRYDLETLVQKSDLIIEALPAKEALPLIRLCQEAQKELILISPAALLLEPKTYNNTVDYKSKISIPSGALSGLDGIKAMRETGLTSVKIITTKPPKGLQNAPFVLDNHMDLSTLNEITRIFKGNAIDAAKGFPANVNVAASLSFAGLGPEKTQVEIRVDPNGTGNQHRIVAKTALTRFESVIESKPDPQNPKSSALTAQSIIALLRDRSQAIRVGT